MVQIKSDDRCSLLAFNCSNFELLKLQVRVLSEHLSLVEKILEENNLVLKETKTCCNNSIGENIHAMMIQKGYLINDKL